LYDSNSRPSIDPLDLVDTQKLLSITVTDRRVNIVIVKYPTQLRIVINTLTTRSINRAVRRKNNSTTARGAALSTLINKSTSSRVRPADHDLVLLSSSRARLVQITALTGAEEHVVTTVVVDHVRGFHGMRARRLEDGIVSSAALGSVGCALHSNLVNIVPEGAKVHEVLVADFDEVGINGVVRFAAVRSYASCFASDAALLEMVRSSHTRALVGPAAHVHSRRSCETNNRVLRAESACRVVEVVSVTNQRHIRCLFRVRETSCTMNGVIDHIPIDQSCQSWQHWHH
jgi:hypothetical protein